MVQTPYYVIIKYFIWSYIHSIFYIKYKNLYYSTTSHLVRQISSALSINKIIRFLTTKEENIIKTDKSNR